MLLACRMLILFFALRRLIRYEDATFFDIYFITADYCFFMPEVAVAIR